MALFCAPNDYVGEPGMFPLRLMIQQGLLFALLALIFTDATSAGRNSRGQFPLRNGASSVTRGAP